MRRRKEPLKELLRTGSKEKEKEKKRTPLGRGWQRVKVNSDDASALSVKEASVRCDLMSDELQEIEIAVWAWKALVQGRIFTFTSRMKRMALRIPAARRLNKTDDDDRVRTVLNLRQRAMASVVLNALIEPSTHRKQQLNEIARGCGALRINPPAVSQADSRLLDVRLRF